MAGKVARMMQLIDNLQIWPVEKEKIIDTQVKERKDDQETVSVLIRSRG